MEVEFKEININNLEGAVKFPSRRIDFTNMTFAAYSVYNLVWICNIQELHRFKFLITLRPHTTGISAYFNLISATNENIEYSVSIGELDDSNAEYSAYTIAGPTKGTCIYITSFSRTTISTFKFFCIIKFDQIHNCLENLLKSINNKQFDHMSEDFGQLLDNKIFSDIILKTSDVELSAHRNILSARSPIFAAIFFNGTIERKDAILHIDDIEPDILRAMLRFIYTGRVEDLESKAVDLYKVADKYELEGLKIMCTEVLSETMSVNNVTDILVLANLYNNENLKSEALIFIKIHLKDVIKLSKFKHLKNTNPGLLLDVIELIAA